MNLSKLHTLLSQYIPELAVPYCTELWHKYGFDFRVSKKRRTKLGDYKYDSVNNTHAISVNNNLNPYNFLITYIHEVAHCAARIEHPEKTLPHGMEWKLIFRQLMLPLLNDTVYPDFVLRALAKHMRNPKASSMSDPKLALVLKKHDSAQIETGRLLADLQTGSTFSLNNRTFKKIKTRRTRVLCREMHSGKNYLISNIASIEVLD